VWMVARLCYKLFILFKLMELKAYEEFVRYKRTIADLDSAPQDASTAFCVGTPRGTTCLTQKGPPPGDRVMRTVSRRPPHRPDLAECHEVSTVSRPSQVMSLGRASTPSTNAQ
jgi:hypothetical protein